MNFVLGLDGGGTKTIAQAIGLDKKSLFRIKGGSLNPNGESPQAVRATIAELINSAVNTAPNKNLAAVCIGAAGISNPSAEKIFREGAADAGFTGKLLLTGDNVTALMGALGKPEGIILISGTGSICTGRNKNKEEARSGGRGHLIDDEGSGYAMGADVLRAVIKADDGRLPPTTLTKSVYEKLNCSDITSIISFVYTPMRPKSEIADFARLLPLAAQQNDAAAIAIYKKAAHELVNLVKAVSIKLNEPSAELALGGSAILNDEYLKKLFCAELKTELPQIKLVQSKHDAAYGAALLALELV